MNTLFERFSSRENLKKAYGYVLDELSHSVLSVNPINHPAKTAINDIGDQFFVALEKYLRDGKYKPERGFFVYVPKDNLALRPVCILSMVDRIVYQAIFNPDILGLKIDGKLSKNCFANRVSDGSGEKYLRSYYNHYDEFCKKQIEAFKDGYTWQLEVDVQQYYEHIPIKNLIQKLSTDFDVKEEKILSILELQLTTWAECESLPKGIPQGPEASAVLGNVYLSSLDKLLEKRVDPKYTLNFRYADDIALMGKSKRAVIEATEKMVYFLREHNLTLNEKTKLAQLENTLVLEGQRIASDYEEVLAVRSELSRVKRNIPATIKKIKSGETLTKLEARELKYYLRSSEDRDALRIRGLIEVLPLKPSLTVHIIQFVATVLGTNCEPSLRLLIERQLWQTYKNEDISPWSKFWILKLLISSVSTQRQLDIETQKMLAKDTSIIFKLAAFYHKTIKATKVDYGPVRNAIDDSESAVEKSLFIFFLLNTFGEQRVSVVRDSIETAVNSSSHDINLIGVYLYKNCDRVKLHDIEGTFAKYLLDLPVYTRSEAEREGIMLPSKDALFMIRASSLIPVQKESISVVLGTKRHRSKQQITLNLPEDVDWSKVTIKYLASGTEVSIEYDGSHIAKADFTDLGFYVGNPENGKRDQQWMFLYALSTYSRTRPEEATVANMARNLATMTKKPIKHNSVHKIKAACAKKLQSLFQTDEEPFFPRKGYYQPRFTLVPVPELRHQDVYIRQK